MKGLKLLKVLLIISPSLLIFSDLYSYPSDGSMPMTTYESRYVGNVPYDRDRFIYLANVRNEAARREEAARERRRTEEKMYHGGVDLRKTARFLQSVGSISSATFDERSGKLYLIGENTMSYHSFLSEDDIAVIYRSVFEDKYGGVSVTIDPDPENLKKWGVAKYTGGIENTHVGQVLFEADRILKCLSSGYDNLTGEKIEPGVRGYEPGSRMALRAMTGNEEHSWQRYWFIPDSMEIDVDRKTGVLFFTRGDINIRTERMEWKGNKLVTATDQKEGSSYSKASSSFVSHIVNNYNSYAAAYPVFYELREIAKLVAIFKWIKEEMSGSMDLSYLAKINITECITPVRTPVVQAVYVMKVDGVEVRSIMTSSGGVTLDTGYRFRYSGHGSGSGSGGEPPVFSALAGFCNDHDDFTEFEYQGRKMVKAAIIDPASMSFMERLISFFNRVLSLLSTYYNKIIM